MYELSYIGVERKDFFEFFKLHGVSELYAQTIFHAIIAPMKPEARRLFMFKMTDIQETGQTFPEWIEAKYKRALKIEEETRKYIARELEIERARKEYVPFSRQ